MSYDIYEDYSLAAPQNTAVPLHLYFRYIGHKECAGMGVYVETSQDDRYCRHIWTANERQIVADALARAQADFESVIGYFLTRTWVYDSLADTEDERLVDDQVIAGNQVRTRYPRLLEMGSYSETEVEAGAEVVHTTDPAIITVTVPDGLNAEQIVVYFEGTPRKIYTSKVTISSTTATIEIPRCRLVKPDLSNNPGVGVNYDDLANFVDAVDVYYWAADQSDQAVLRGRKLNPTFGEDTGTAWLWVENAHVGVVRPFVGTYSDGNWTRSNISCTSYSRIGLNYSCGMRILPEPIISGVIRLAHSMMAAQPCGCDDVTRLWERDQFVPVFIPLPRLACPWGTAEGGWQAWNLALRLSSLRTGSISAKVI